MDRSRLINDLEEGIRIALEGNQSNLWTAIPAIVTKINFSVMTCEAQIAVQGTSTNALGETTPEEPILLVDVPIVFPSAGGFTLTFPLAVGNEILVILASRCIDAWWYYGGIQLPSEIRIHDLSDGFAIPGPKSKPRVLSGVSSNTVQLRNDAGTAYVEIDGSGNINLVGTTVKINGQNFHSHEHSLSIPSTPYSLPTGPVTP